MKDVNKLRWVKVISIALSIKGIRDENFGHWHYYADPKIPFTKVIYMTNFDKHNAPDDGYGLLIEIPAVGNKNTGTLINKVVNDLYKLKVLNRKDKVIDIHFWEVNPAFVIFTKETPAIVARSKEYLQEYGVSLAGRYGNWEYSSMAENIEDGLNFVKQLK
jgi:protoporphyrinogen oxidase